MWFYEASNDSLAACAADRERRLRSELLSADSCGRNVTDEASFWLVRSFEAVIETLDYAAIVGFIWLSPTACDTVTVHNHCNILVNCCTLNFFQCFILFDISNNGLSVRRVLDGRKPFEKLDRCDFLIWLCCTLRRVEIDVYLVMLTSPIFVWLLLSKF